MSTMLLLLRGGPQRGRRWLACVTTFILLVVVGQLPLVNAARAGGGSGSRSAGGGGFSSSGGSRSSYWAPAPSGPSGFSSSGSSGGIRYGSSVGSGVGAVTGARSGESASARAPVSSIAGSSSRWGSSAPSGVSSGGRMPSSGPLGGSSGNPRANYAVAGNSATRSANNRPTVNAPQASQHIPLQPTYNTHYTTINNFGGAGGYGRSGFGTGSLLLAGAGGAIGGYMLGSMIASSVYRDHSGCCYGCGCAYYGVPPPYYYDTYVPYRYRYLTDSNETKSNTTATSNGMTSPTVPPIVKSINLCTLARWNMELPFTELPNMVMSFLADDKISGVSGQDKAGFFYNFLTTTAESYGSLNATTNVFIIPPSYDLKVCNFNVDQPSLLGRMDNEAALLVMGNGTSLKPADSTTGNSNWTVSLTTSAPDALKTSTQGAWFNNAALMNVWREKVRNGDRSVCVIASFANIPECISVGSTPKIEEPFRTAVRQVVRLYSNASVDQQMITDLIASVKHCFPSDVVPPMELRTCLDFSISSDQATSLGNQGSLFANEELCKKYLAPDINQCLPSDKKQGSAFDCGLNDLVNIIVFARNYYLCSDPVDQSLVDALQGRQVGKSTSNSVPMVLSGTVAPYATSGFSIISSSALPSMCKSGGYQNMVWSVALACLSLVIRSLDRK